MWAFWKNQRQCKFVEESVGGSGVYFFRNLHGVGALPRDFTGGKGVGVEAKGTELKGGSGSGSGISTAMSFSRNSNAKRRLSHGVAAALPLLTE